MIIYETTEHPI